MTTYLGDYLSGETVYFMWSSNGADGASITRATNGTISVYKDNSTTQTTTGVTDTEDFDSLTGIHHVAVATTDSFYTTATDFIVVLSGATIDGKTVNAVLAHFSIENRTQKADVTKWNGSAVASPDTAGHPKVTIKSGTGTGEISLSSGTVALSATSRAAVADDVWDEATAGHTSAGSTGKALTDANNGTPPSANAIADQVWDEVLSGHLGAGSTGEALSNASSGGSSPSTIADAVWDEALSGHTTAGTAGKALSDAGSAVDPWNTSVPGAYAAGKAGYILGTYLDQAVSSMNSSPGAGAIQWVYTLTSSEDSSPIPDADVWITSDSAGNNLLASGRTNGSGQVTFYLDTGTVYVWRQKSGWNFSNPDVEEVGD